MDDVVQNGMNGSPQSVLVVAEDNGKSNAPRQKQSSAPKAIPVVTTESIQLDGMEFVRHLPVIFSRRVYGFNILAEMMVGITDTIGGRSKRMEQAIEDIETEVVDDLRRKARLAGATAVVGLNVHIGNLSGDKSMLMYGCANGTPVFMKKTAKVESDDFEFTDSLEED